MNDVTVGFLGFSEAYLGAFGEGKGQDMWVAVPLVSGSGRSRWCGISCRGSGSTAAPETPISHYVLTHYNALMATKAALEKSGKIDREALVDGLEGLSIDSPTGPLGIGSRRHHVTLEHVPGADRAATGLVTVEDWAAGARSGLRLSPACAPS